MAFSVTVPTGDGPMPPHKGHPQPQHGPAPPKVPPSVDYPGGPTNK